MIRKKEIKKEVQRRYKRSETRDTRQKDEERNGREKGMETQLKQRRDKGRERKNTDLKSDNALGGSITVLDSYNVIALIWLISIGNDQRHSVA